jgi:hypothetical protein
MSRDVRRSFIRSTALYTIFTVLLLWLIFFNDYRLGDLGSFLPMSEQMTPLSINIILVPLAVSVTIFYIAALVGLFLEGPIAEISVGTLYATGFGAFFSLFLILNPSAKIGQAGYYLLAAFAVLLAYNLIATISRLKDRTSVRLLAISATIFAEGQIAVRLVNLLIDSSGATMHPEMVQAVAEFISLGVTIAAVFTALAVFRNSRNSYLAALGGIASNYLFSVSLSLIGALYYGFFLGGLKAYAPNIVNLSPYVEWTGICVFAALIFTVMRRGMQGHVVVQDHLGEWRKHVQSVITYKGDRFVNFVDIVDDFVEKGSKERLVVNLTLFLDENHISDDEVSEILGPLINYEDHEKPDLSRRGRAQQVEEENKLNRLEVLQGTISRIVPGGGPMAMAGIAVDAGRVTEAEAT